MAGQGWLQQWNGTPEPDQPKNLSDVPMLEPTGGSTAAPEMHCGEQMFDEVAERARVLDNTQRAAAVGQLTAGAQPLASTAAATNFNATHGQCGCCTQTPCKPHTLIISPERAHRRLRLVAQQQQRQTAQA